MNPLPPAPDPTVLAACKDGDTPATAALISALRRQVESEAKAREAKEQAKQLALPGPPGQPQQKKAQEKEDDDSSSSEEEELPPDPQNCTVSGPGFTVSVPPFLSSISALVCSAQQVSGY